MAKSIRSKSKRKFRAIKREQVFAPVETARVNRLSAAQKAGSDMQAESEEPVADNENSAVEASTEDMVMDDATTGNKISLKKKEEKKKKKTNDKQPRQIKRVQLQKKKKPFQFHRK
ncbi:hypothetical protein K493DRAFT_310867 [Basidiobolus meristosporus CBS 931.73]|uniref:DUF2423 domain-containing protein n=1 Tax=Basidiobolus meristosporus CBS 931.73 TaxID=1314790 RepID=A0A1Y1Z5N6_9FUNG|nr:hypothetical protein K493DRAFT_310867 [Basidiobolus meristosporus CBS 931.73]|eukprot:ORY05608.1 hypothetical protein K493DRAFT_310867 [Basidiobolus meristosporus CBS 931.73]